MAFHVYTEDQLMGIENAREFAQERILPVLRELDDNGTFPKDIIEAGFEMGFHALDFPEEYGGLGFDANTACIIFEELAKADSGIACAYSVTGTAIAPIMEYGTHEQKKIVQELVLEKGGLASFCLTEPTSGSDSGSARTRAVREGDEYVINGNKCFITNGAYANLYFVVASTDPSKGNKGLSTFIVPAGTPGLSIGREEIKCGFRTSNTVRLQNNNGRHGPRQTLHRRYRSGYRPESSGGGYTLFQIQIPVWKTHLRQSGHTVHARGYGDPNGSGQMPCLPCCGSYRPETSYQSEWLHLQMLCHRCRNEGYSGCCSDIRRLRLHQKLPCGKTHARCETFPDS